MFKILFEPSEIKIFTPIIKTKIKYTQGWLKNFLNYKKFVNHKVHDKTILITEANYTHSEVIPSYIKYFSELGYKIDVLVMEKCVFENPFVKLDVSADFYYVPQKFYDKCILSEQIKNYDCVLFTSNQVYLKHGKISSVLDVYKEIKKPKNRFIVSEHHLELLKEEDYTRSKVISLPAWIKNFDERIDMVNPCYFYPVKFNPNKNTKTRFIIVGGLTPNRKNIELFNNAFSEILDMGFKNFEIIITGEANKKDFPKKLLPYIKIKGHTNFNVMYKELEKADFMLPLLDPDSEIHNRYTECGTSGNFQLSYGFRLPMVIAKKFAEPNLLNNENSIIYNKNSDFKNATIRAINMENSEYKRFVNSLNKLYNDLHNKSLESLRNIVS